VELRGLYVFLRVVFQNMEAAWAWALGLHVLAWYMQIHPGHALLEKRRPALFDSLLQVDLFSYDALVLILLL
jgi:uncharacterized membrane protein YGL010W